MSVGTLYHYYPNDKQPILFAVLHQHLSLVTKEVEQACAQHHNHELPEMVDAIMKEFIDAKLSRPDISMALYSIASELDARALVNKITKRGLAALSSMLATALNAHFEDLQFAAVMLYSAMSGGVKAVLEAGAPPKFTRM